MSSDKDFLRSLMKKQKEETLIKNKKLIDKYRKEWEDNNKKECDLLKDKIYLHFCESKEDKEKWTAFLHLTSSLPYRGAVGRRIKILVMCKDVILGMIHLTSPLAQCSPRDKFIGFKDAKEKWKEINNYYNILACVPTHKYSQLLTGKLLVYCIFSQEIHHYIISKYGGKCLGFETTSLFGKSSMYNRIPFLDDLGETDGYSAVCISDEDWLKIKQEWVEKCPTHLRAGKDTSRLAEAKYQVIAKLEGWYKRNKIPFPYIYKQDATKRGVYFGFMKNPPPMAVRVEDWRSRWLKMRLAGGFKAREDL